MTKHFDTLTLQIERLYKKETLPSKNISNNILLLILFF